LLRLSDKRFDRKVWHVEITVRPGKKPGTMKTLFKGELSADEVTISEAGDVTLSVVADDIYTKQSSHLFTISLNRDEFVRIARAAGIP
jgi:hypothetical protein